MSCCSPPHPPRRTTAPSPWRIPHGRWLRDHDPCTVDGLLESALVGDDKKTRLAAAGTLLAVTDALEKVGTNQISWSQRCVPRSEPIPCENIRINYLLTSPKYRPLDRECFPPAGVIAAQERRGISRSRDDYQAGTAIVGETSCRGEERQRRATAA